MLFPGVSLCGGHVCRLKSACSLSSLSPLGTQSLHMKPSCVLGWLWGSQQCFKVCHPVLIEYGEVSGTIGPSDVFAGCVSSLEIAFTCQNSALGPMVPHHMTSDESALYIMTKPPPTGAVSLRQAGLLALASAGWVLSFNCLVPASARSRLPIVLVWCTRGDRLR